MAKSDTDYIRRIKVIGCGGGGGNAVNRMVEAGLQGVEFVAINTDAQVLATSLADIRLQIGDSTTRGMGAGGDPAMGQKAAEEDINQIQAIVDGADMVFVTAGMGGGTGTGAAPVVAEAARRAGALTVAVVTKPFLFEGRRRQEVAREGLFALRNHIDTLITVPNENLMHVVDKRAPLIEAFHMVDDILRQGVQGIAELIITPGLISLDFNDVRAVMKDAGSALMGIGSASGEGRAGAAAQMATSSPLLEGDIRGARSILFNITAGYDLAMSEAEEAAKRIAGDAGLDDTNVIFGVVLDDAMEDELRLTVVATGFDLGDDTMAPPVRTTTTTPSRRATTTPSSRPATGGAGGQSFGGGTEDDLNIPSFLRHPN